MTQVLYRKYRPRIFSEIVGQEHIITTLQNALLTGEAAHAYLFTGPRGTGKTTVARIFAKALNCTARKKAEACLTCVSCLEFDRGSHVDLIEIDAASNRGIDEIRSLKEAVRFTPAHGQYKIYLIDEVHMLTREAFNAILKTIEEPPAHVLFILATTEPHKVLATVASRCQRFDFHYLTHEEIAARLRILVKKEDKNVDEASLKLVIAASGGSLRDAESILGKVLSLESVTVPEVRTILGIADTALVTSFLEHIATGEKESALNVILAASERGDSLQFVDGAVEYARLVLLGKLSPQSLDVAASHLSKEEKESVQKIADILTEKEIYNIIRELLEAAAAMKHSPIPHLPLELAVVKLAQEKKS